ncbi:MAG: PQQ-binding-like beta-propeller repeat protein [Planctomycetes bacterium]|nr:PQQ-binding-like beta-propeller repeat protein [Planctomycetota bacterium]
MGVLPANGLLYSSPYSCTCSSGEMIPGLNAYSSLPNIKKSSDPITVNISVQLEKGPAYGSVKKLPISDGDWPTYRENSARAGVNRTTIYGTLKENWKAKLPGTPSSIISVGNSVFVADVQAHTLYSIAADTGKISWSYTTDGRVDSPPTYYKGLLLFGSNDGWVYCLRARDGVLAWRFRDLPKRLIHADGQLESAWPIFGSVLVHKDKLYFSAGRSTFVDGGIFVYCLNPINGELIKKRNVYGPFKKGSSFPLSSKNTSHKGGFLNDILVAKGDTIYLRHRAFDLNLDDTDKIEAHIMPLSSFLDGNQQHRTGWIINNKFNWWQAGVKDILVMEGTECYAIQGFPTFGNHSYFDPRRQNYQLVGGPVSYVFNDKSKGTGKKKKKGKKGKKKKGNSAPEPMVSSGVGWKTDLPSNCKAIAKAGSTIFLAGAPMKFEDKSFENYVKAYKGKLGGSIIAVSAEDGKIISEIKLDAAPVWDSLIVANERLFIALNDGSIRCFSGDLRK